MIKTLNSLEIGKSARILRINAPAIIKRRLVSMGVTPGSEVLMKRHAPLLDPIEIDLGGYLLSLRLEEASYIEVEDLDQSKVTAS